MRPIGNDFLIGAEGAVFGKLLHVLVQGISVCIPEAQRFTFRVKSVFANELKIFFRGDKGHCRSPCGRQACKVMVSAIKKPNPHPRALLLRGVCSVFRIGNT